jgi:CRISPR-associated endonuclease Csn1
MKKILGLDLGTNSIGWALIERDFENGQGKIIDIGSRIIPMSQDILGAFDSGQSVSQTAERTGYRGIRRLRERHLLRRERLHRTLQILGFLPHHYSIQIDFENKLGQFIGESEPKIAYKLNSHTNKFEFIFQNSFQEMLQDFSIHQPELIKSGKKVPYDWTIYYLRKKALTQKIEKEELAWLLLHFNQKRGYYQVRGEDEKETKNQLVEFHSLLVVDVVDSGDKKGNETWYNVILENGWIYRRTSKTPLDWIGKAKEFIVTTELDEDGNIKKNKEGKEKRSFRSPSEDDWTLIKKKTEFDIDTSKQIVGEYIYDNLLHHPNQKIKGKLIRVIERKYYKAELKNILETQKKFHKELQDRDTYNACMQELYEFNEAHRNNNIHKDFTYFFLDDIIFYQRPLKSKTSLISDCKYEVRYFKDNEGRVKSQSLKCIAKSNPLFQEFRLLQWVKNIRIFIRETDEDVTAQLIKDEYDWTALFDWLNNKKEISQEQLLKYPSFNLKKDWKNYRWNFVEDKIYPCNETRFQLTTRLSKVKNVPAEFLNKGIEEKLWHILYSVEDHEEIKKALGLFAHKNNLGDDFVEAFRKFPSFKKEYGSYSAKAIKKLLTLMRFGKNWSETVIDVNTRERINKITDAEYDEKIKMNIREKAINLSSINDFQGLPLWLASYIIYNRHSEDGENKKWNTADEIEFLKQHSLRNPIVEQIINETLRVVKDIWILYGDNRKIFFDEIHIELGREMKNNATERKYITEQIAANENTNLRIRALLSEFLNDGNIENVRPYSPSQQEILKIYEDGVLKSYTEKEIPEDILKISKSSQPSAPEIIRYKLWLEQKYRSPYTGEIIPLNRLFTPAYEIEHIIPQSRYFDDSFSNKIICESEVNKLKDNQLGFEFIKNHGGEKVSLNFGKTVEIFNEDAYTDFVKKHYANNRSKLKKLLVDEIPESFIQRQMNDTRYISKIVKNLLSNIVREKDEQETTSKNLISSNGNITSILKQDWGLNDVWNDIITPRFERLNAMTNSKNFGEINKATNKFLPRVPLHLQKGFNKKRIDHRHHAMDALIIACATRSHINYLNNQSASEKGKSKDEKQQLRYALRNKLCYKKYNDQRNDNYKWIFNKPWPNFTHDAKEKLDTTIVSFKNNIRVINKTVNYYQKWIKEENGLKKGIIKQTKGDNWAIRKSMHKDTVSGKVNLSWVKVPKGKILTATRKSIDVSFNLDTIRSITDKSIQEILKNHLAAKENNPEIAFSPEGIEDLNKNIAKYNNDTMHPPIYKVRVFELGSKFTLGQTGNKKNKYVEAAKGTNLFFAIYHEEQTKKRSFETIPLNLVIERLKQGLSPISEINETGNKLAFSLSPNDLVYVPSQEEQETPFLVDFENLSKEQTGRIYKAVSSSTYQCFFLRHDISVSIVNKMEFSPLNKMERAMDGIMVKDVCWKLQVNRLGKIVKINKCMPQHSGNFDIINKDPVVRYSKHTEPISDEQTEIIPND